MISSKNNEPKLKHVHSSGRKMANKQDRKIAMDKVKKNTLRRAQVEVVVAFFLYFRNERPTFWMYS